MLTKITLENFKLFKSVTVEPALVTLLIGPNGTGKSSIIQALVLLKQSGLAMPLYTRGGRGISLGQFSDLVHGHNEIGIIGIALEVTTPARQSEYQARYNRDGVVDHPTADGHNWGDGPPNNRPGEKNLNDFLQSLRLVRVLRGFTQPSYDIQESKRELEDVEEQESRAAFATTNLLLAPLHVQRRVKELSEEVVGRGIAPRNAPGRKAFLGAPDGDELTNVVHEGFGLNQWVELVEQLVEAPNGALLCVEEPEIHLHPGAQAKLGRVLGREAKARHVQLLMTTHSEHILMSFLTQVAKKELRSEDLAVYYFERKDGYAEAERLEVTEKGTIRSGMRGFFEVGLEELEEYVKARLGQA